MRLEAPLLLPTHSHGPHYHRQGGWWCGGWYSVPHSHAECRTGIRNEFVAISGACGTQGGWWQLLGEAPEHWACSLTHMLSGDMLGTTWGDEEGTVPPEPQFAKLCEFTRDMPFDNENDRLMTDEQKLNS